MTAQPFDFHHRYTVAEFAALPEDDSARYELQDGSLVVAPRPSIKHMRVIYNLCTQLDEQLPADLMSVPEIDVDLRIGAGTVRIPDLVVIPAALEDSTVMATAADLCLAVEIISPGSVRTDTKVKPFDYADAGIPNLWLIDPEQPITATILTLVDGEYEESQRAEHSFTVTEPCPLTIDLDGLRRSADRG